MASSSSVATAAASHSNDSDSDDTMDRLVWFRRPDTEQWWPAYSYPSHAAALEAYGHDKFQRMEPHAQRKRLTVTYLSEVCDQRERPAVRLMGVQPVALWGVGVDEQGRDLDANATTTPCRLQRDFVRNLAHRLDHVARPGTDLWNAMKEVRNLLAGEGGNSHKEKSASASVKKVVAAATAPAGSTMAASCNNSSRGENTEASGGCQHQKSFDEDTSSKENEGEEMNGNPPPATREEETDDDGSEDVVMNDDQASKENKEEANGSDPTATRENDDESEDFVMNDNDHGDDDDDEAAKDDPKSKSTGLATTKDDVEGDDDDWEDDDEEEVPLNILSNDSWETVLEKFRNAGWAERAGLYPDNPLQVVYYKVGSGGTGEGCREGVDYFTLEQFQGFIEREHGWDGGRPKRPRVTLSVHRGAAGRNHHKTPLAQRTKPQDPGLPLEESEVESGDDDEEMEDVAADSPASDESSVDSEDRYTFSVLYSRLRAEGWTHCKARNKLGNYWYIRPGRSVKGGKPGEDYFLSETQVIEYCQTQDRAIRKDPVRAVAVGGLSAARKRKGGSKRLPRAKKLLASDRKKRNAAKKYVEDEVKAKGRTKSLTRKTKANGPWWKDEPVPSFQKIWPILEKIGFSKTSDGKFLLPKNTPLPEELGRVPTFQSYDGLRKFLCAFGIPCFQETSARLLRDEPKQLCRWVTFANVPVHSGNSIERLANVSSFKKKPDDIVSSLHVFGFESLDGKVYVPKYKKIRRAGEAWGTAIPRVHFFDVQKDLEMDLTDLQVYVRGAWRFGLLFDSEDDKGPDKFLPPSECMDSRKQESHLRLRLWAAAESKEPLPTFTEESLGIADKAGTSIVSAGACLEPFEMMPQSVEDTNQPNGENGGGSAKSKNKRPRALVSVTPKKKKNAKLRTTTEHWWKHEPVPSFQNIWPMLEKLAFSKTEADKFLLPENIPGMDKIVGRIPVFSTRSGLRKFLCQFGVPCYLPETDTRLDDAEKEQLHRWITFANVPVHSGNSIERLADITAPRNDAELLSWLSKFRFDRVDGNVYVPDYKQIRKAGEAWGATIALPRVHFFDEKKELKKGLRVFVRGAWRLGLMFDSKEAQLDADCFLTPSKFLKSKDQEAHMRLRLWGATTSMDLPKFSAESLELLTKDGDKLVPVEARLAPYEIMPDIEEDLDDFPSQVEELSASDAASPATPSASDTAPSSSDEESLTTPSEKDAAPETPGSTSDTSAASASDDNAESVASPDSSVASVDSQCFGDSEWYKKIPGPDFMIQIWPILKRLGFWYKSQYGHPFVREPIGDSVAVQKFCVRNGIPNLDDKDIEITAQERELLHRWAIFAFVDVRPSNSVAKLSGAKELTEKRARVLLSRLGFQFNGDMVYPPGSDDIPGARENRKRHVHFWYWSEIRDFIRERESFNLTEGDSFGRRRQPLIAEDMFALRRWAALSPSPLPTFIPPESNDEPTSEEHDEAAMKSDRVEDSTEEPEADETVQDTDMSLHGTTEAQQETASAEDSIEITAAVTVEEVEKPMEEQDKAPKEGDRAEDSTEGPEADETVKDTELSLHGPEALRENKTTEAEKTMEEQKEALNESGRAEDSTEPHALVVAEDTNMSMPDAEAQKENETTAAVPAEETGKFMQKQGEAPKESAHAKDSIGKAASTKLLAEFKTPSEKQDSSDNEFFDAKQSADSKAFAASSETAQSPTTVDGGTENSEIDLSGPMDLMETSLLTQLEPDAAMRDETTPAPPIEDSKQNQSQRTVAAESHFDSILVTATTPFSDEANESLGKQAPSPINDSVSVLPTDKDYSVPESETHPDQKKPAAREARGDADNNSQDTSAIWSVDRPKSGAGGEPKCPYSPSDKSVLQSMTKKRKNPALEKDCLQHQFGGDDDEEDHGQNHEPLCTQLCASDDDDDGLSFTSSLDGL